jgi:hypothetical protein
MSEGFWQMTSTVMWLKNLFLNQKNVPTFK